ncbi:MAG: SgrR family transcriptional regulator [Aliivibrio sp.]|uniref:SgrR family transcriptional regulator n=1 Tax=Aliivibrio sp. TaxID=1872443 RepID=UPI001A3B3AD4|nr:SgrR family transcriptional regulator [Aliivibrio sp.]
MSSPRLKTQFEQLSKHFSGQSSNTHLHVISEVLFCTRRNTRMVINKMVEEGWVEWIPAVGRGKSSRLNFIRSNDEVNLELATRHVEDGRLDQALITLNNDAKLLAQVIQDKLGFSQQQGKQVVRLPYYRQFVNLNPQKPVRRSEQHIIKQIFSGLTKIDENSEQLCGDLAHHWESLTPKHWRFYLRPSVRFHDGHLLNINDIIDTFAGLLTTDLFCHIKQVHKHTDNTVDFILKVEDHSFPVLLSHIEAKILPSGYQDMVDFNFKPIGTGPYRVISNDAQRLILEAHDYYYGFRPLVDNVEVWVLDKISAMQLAPGIDLPAGDHNGVSSKVELDQGCSYLLFNRNSGVCTQPEWLHYLQSKLHSYALFSNMSQHDLSSLGLINAHGLLPGKRHVHKVIDEIISAPTNKRVITLAYPKEHPVYPLIAKAMTCILAKDGIRLIIKELNLLQLASGEYDNNIDFWISGMSLGNHRDDSLLGWFYRSSEIKRATPKDEFEQMCQIIDEWRGSGQMPFPVNELSKQLVTSGQLLPLFHGWMGILDDQLGVVQNADCNGLGWFDFSTVWMKPAVTPID